MAESIQTGAGDIIPHNNNDELSNIVASLPEISFKHLIDFACQEGPMEITKSLLADPRIDLTENSNNAILTAAHGGQCEIVQLLLHNKRVTLRPNGHFALKMICKAGDMPAMLKILADKGMDWEHGRHQTMFQGLLFEACQLGRLDILRFLLQGNLVSKKRHPEPDSLVGAAAATGHCEVVRLLVQDRRVNKGLNIHFSFKYYCAVGDTERVRALLANPQIDPSANGNNVLVLAVEAGNLDVIKLLLADPRVNPAARGNYLVQLASQTGDSSVVKLFLDDPRVIPSDERNLALRSACWSGHVAVVELLLHDSRVIQADGVECAFEAATSNAQLDVLTMLLARPGVVLTKEILAEAIGVSNCRKSESVIILFIAAQPHVVSRLCSDGGVVWERNSVLGVILDRWYACSAMCMLLCVKRTQTQTVAGRLADVLREVLGEFAKFAVVPYDDSDDDQDPRS